MNEKVTLFEQMDSKVGPVILINKINVKEEQVQEFLEAWADNAKYFKQQSRFISAWSHAVGEFILIIGIYHILVTREVF